jgi:hypothetical protein
MLDWIFQISNKTWATPDVAKDMLTAFEHIFRPQRNLCSSAMTHNVYGTGNHLEQDFVKKRMKNPEKYV